MLRSAARDAAGIPHAVVGGHAVAAWVARIDPAAVRTTVDVDLLIERADLPQAIAAFEAVGFEHSFTCGSNIFVDGPQGKAREAVHILFAGEPVKPADPAPAPELTAAQMLDGYRIVDLDRLITMAREKSCVPFFTTSDEAADALAAWMFHSVGRLLRHAAPRATWCVGLPRGTSATVSRLTSGSYLASSPFSASIATWETAGSGIDTATPPPRATPG